MKQLLLLLFPILTIFPITSTAQDTFGRNDFVRYAEKLREVYLKTDGFSGDIKANTEKIQKMVFGNDATAQKIDSFEYTGFITYLSVSSALPFSPNKTTPNRITLAFDLLENLESPMETESMELVMYLLNGVFNEYHEFRYAEMIMPLAKSRNPIVYDGGVEIIADYWRPEDEKNRYCPSYLPYPWMVLEIPKNFASLGLYDKAWRTYCEHALVSSGAERLDTTAAQNWKLAAENAYLAGEKKLAWQLLMKAAVFGGEWLFDEVKQTARLWNARERSQKELPRPEVLQGDKRREAWDAIISLYQEMNAHPRAWALIDEYPEEFENPEELKQKIQADWIRVVERFIPKHPDSAVKSVTVYGYRLYPDGVDPLTVKVPWAFSAESIKKAKAHLAELAEECMNEDDDEFRTWYRDSPSEAFQAKYVPGDGKSVQVEKPDGQRMYLIFEKLVEPDKSYARRRMEIDKITPEEREYFRKLRLEFLEP